MYSLPSHRDHLKMTSLLISLRETVFLAFRESNAVIVVVDVVDVVIVVVVCVVLPPVDSLYLGISLWAWKL